MAMALCLPQAVAARLQLLQGWVMLGSLLDRWQIAFYFD